ncbi:hypothetical protein GUITHDRAFT_132870 [Guillardia theta CCMP2712]|uniref:Uncharacterized protein n=1 Tax=Guillardia theta (strain CCMP2712) TaxID=905079 RepID=L1K0E0_GUITC|nr:hypothetical protein GUITHDRAFT_132870 [Guillardia theta CCMP2712]EKX53823.1 hypothetical protein GUITHDRAFT_132870 [Guillardia theta CCMP2712]|eukprot:XP_005840803.1 hypothetical protein GUITHDRAFT_132870 [Guillardia theta CCMP2712]
MRRLNPAIAVGIAAATLMLMEEKLMEEKLMEEKHGDQMVEVVDQQEQEERETLLVSTVLILTQVDNYSVLDEQDLAIPRGSERIANLQMKMAREHDIYGKDTTYDLNYITSLKPGDVSVAGYEGLPQEKGGLPDSKELAAADALLTHAISTQTMPDGIDKVWDGKPYVPDDDLKEKLSKAWAGFHQAVGEKRWEKKVYEKCGQAGTLDPACQEVLGGKHEGYDTKWDGEQWTQWNGLDWVKLEPDA